MKGLVQIDIGLIAASIVALSVGFTLRTVGTQAIWSGSTEAQAERTAAGTIHSKSFDLAVSTGPQIPDDPGARAARLETDVASESAVGQSEGASELSAANTPCAAFDDRFYFDRRTASFGERFASAFASPENTAGNAPNAGERADNTPDQLDFGERAKSNPAATQSTPVPASVATSRLASVREERLNTREASLGLRLPHDTDSRTAIYDIAARTVYLPNGNKLEAHSGLGSHLDDARYIRAKGQGPTPPNVYNLALREHLFHGVRAIRLVPVDDGKMFGRDGMLAHTYMLGPSGQSNGCVSFRNYPAFLNAYLKGEVDRLVVVEHLATTTSAKASAARGG